MVEFEKNVGLVYKVFNERFSMFKHYQDDLIQEGMLGLWRACQMYDSSKGVAFSTFATVCIKNNMGMFMRKESKHLGVISLDDEISEEDGQATYLENVEAKDKSMEEVSEFGLIMELIEKTKYADIVKMRLMGMTQAEIAKELGISPTAVSERLQALYRIIRKELNEETH